MIASKNDDKFRFAVTNDVDILIDRVGRARIPLVLRNPLACRHDVEALIAAGPEEVPTAREMTDQAMRLVLRRNTDAADAGIQGIGKGEVDDPRLTAEIDRGL